MFILLLLSVNNYYTFNESIHLMYIQYFLFSFILLRFEQFYTFVQELHGPFRFCVYFLQFFIY